MIFSLEQESEEEQVKLSVKSLGHVLHVFVNGHLVGEYFSIININFTGMLLL